MTIITSIWKRFWPKHIRNQLIIGIALVHLLLMAVFVYDIVRRQQNFLREQNEGQARTLVSNYIINTQQFLIGNDYGSLQRITLAQKNFPYLKYAMVISPENIVLAHTDQTKVGTQLTDSVSRLIEHIKEPGILLEDNTVIDMAAPVKNQNLIIGWVRVGVGQEYIKDNLLLISRNGLLYILFALLIGSFFAIIIARRLSGGLYKLIDTAKSITGGNRQTRSSEFSTVEINRLSLAFNQMLDEISENEKLLTAIVENMPVGVFVLDKDGTILTINSEAKKIWSGGKYVGMTDFGEYKGWFRSTGKRSDAHEWAGARAISKGEITINEEMEIECFDGTRKIILNSAMPLLDSDGKIIRAIVINVDISDKRKAESDLIRVNHAIGERVKELNCLYKISELANSPAKTMEEILQESVAFIPPSYQFPDIASARIIFDNKAYLSAHFEASEIKQTSLITSGETSLGKVEVFYKAGNTIDTKAIFLQEEQLLLDSIADILGNSAEKKKQEMELRQSEEKFRSLVEQSLVGVFILQNDFFLYVNPGLEKISGYSKKELEGNMFFTQLVHPDDVGKVTKNYQRRISGHKADNQYSFRAVAKSGQIRYMEAIVSQITFNNQPAIIGTIIDITDRVEEEKRIGKAVTDAQERERTEIGMELHDNVQQIMVGTLINIEFAKGKTDDKTIVEKTFADVSMYIGNALQELRRLSHQLAPSMSMPGSFTDKIRHLVNTMNKANKIEFSIDGEYENDWFGEDIQISLYRIMQEQFSNIFKYAEASHVWITIQQDKDLLRLTIKDDGKGFDPNTAKRGIGLENINRRAYVLGGSLKIITAYGEGCELQIELPLK